MDKVIRKVADIDSGDRHALEHLVGKHLAEHEQVIISIVNLASAVGPSNPATQEIPDWWKVYEGLNDLDVDRLDLAIRGRANLTRVFE